MPRVYSTTHGTWFLRPYSVARHQQLGLISNAARAVADTASQLVWAFSSNGGPRGEAHIHSYLRQS